MKGIRLIIHRGEGFLAALAIQLIIGYDVRPLADEVGRLEEEGR